MKAPTENLYAIEIAPQWVKEHTVDLGYEHDTSSPFYFLLTDYQDYIDRERTFSYTRTVQRINDASRLEDASLLVSELNEKHQRVFFHSVEIIRDGKRIDALDDENIAVYQRETALESHVVTGRKTVALTIDDLRVGDTLDVRMTFCNFASTHPLHGKFYLSTFWLGWSCPVVLQSVRVINSGHTALLVQRGGANKELGSVRRIEAGKEFYRQWNNLAPVSIGPHVPNWVWSDFLQFTTDNTWPSVSRYLYNYYEANGVLNTPIDVNNIDLLTLTGDQQEDLLTIVRFVQNSVRYRGENHGIYTHMPKSPERTLKKRAGDCKDKSNLMVTLLRRIGVEATLVLVNTRFGGKIAGLNPSAYQFDHMIVKVSTQGKTLYFDPTIQAQAGDLEHCAQLSYGYGLELTAAGSELTEIPFDLDRQVFELEHHFDFKDLKNSAELVIRRRYFFHRADNMRFYLNAKDEKTLRQDYLRGARETTGCRLEVLEPIRVQDDRKLNVLETEERYLMVDLKHTHPSKVMHVTTEFTGDLPMTLDDHLPLDLHLDGRLTHTIYVDTRLSSNLHASKERIQNTWFDYRDSVANKGQRATFVAELRPRTGYVPAGEIEGYSRDVERVRARSSNNFVYERFSFFKQELSGEEAAKSVFYALGIIALLLFIRFLLRN